MELPIRMDLVLDAILQMRADPNVGFDVDEAITAVLDVFCSSTPKANRINGDGLESAAVFMTHCLWIIAKRAVQGGRTVRLTVRLPLTS